MKTKLLVYKLHTVKDYCSCFRWFWAVFTSNRFPAERLSWFRLNICSRKRSRGSQIKVWVSNLVFLINPLRFIRWSFGGKQTLFCKLGLNQLSVKTRVILWRSTCPLVCLFEGYHSEISGYDSGSYAAEVMEKKDDAGIWKDRTIKLYELLVKMMFRQHLENKSTLCWRMHLILFLHT